MELVLIRGLPGSGKSTMAKTMAETHVHLEADMFFVDGHGKYTFDHTKLNDAHEWCQKATVDALSAGQNVVVSNTFTIMLEIQQYLDISYYMGHDMKVIEATGSFGSIHDVPDEVVKRMKDRWEEYDA